MPDGSHGGQIGIREEKPGSQVTGHSSLNVNGTPVDPMDAEAVIVVPKSVAVASKAAWVVNEGSTKSGSKGMIGVGVTL